MGTATLGTLIHGQQAAVTSSEKAVTLVLVEYEGWEERENGIMLMQMGHVNAVYVETCGCTLKN